MFRITREVSFCYGHRLFPYEGKCARLHGHNGRLRVSLASGRLDEAGMVLDFAEVKAALARWLDDTLDHRLILHRDDPAVAALRAIGEQVYAVDFNPTAENLARHVCEHLRSLGLPVVEVELHETDNCSASYAPEGGPAAGGETSPVC
jgi:6-pyruvoyltetrahydropterin/6-carboxytetrahydropterin synthase